MSNTDSLNPSNLNTDDRARLDLVTEQLERLTAVLAGFPGQVVSLLSGVPQEAPTRRRGRPVGSKNKPKPVELAKPDHPIYMRAVDLVNKAGRMTQNELAQVLSKEQRKTVPNSLVSHHMRKAVQKGIVKEVKYYPNGKSTVVFERPGFNPLTGR